MSFQTGRGWVKIRSHCYSSIFENVLSYNICFKCSYWSFCIMDKLPKSCWKDNTKEHGIVFINVLCLEPISSLYCKSKAQKLYMDSFLTLCGWISKTLCLFLLSNINYHCSSCKLWQHQKVRKTQCNMQQKSIRHIRYIFHKFCRIHNIFFSSKII